MNSPNTNPLCLPTTPTTTHHATINAPLENLPLSPGKLLKPINGPSTMLHTATSKPSLMGGSRNSSPIPAPTSVSTMAPITPPFSVVTSINYLGQTSSANVCPPLLPTTANPHPTPVMQHQLQPLVLHPHLQPLPHPLHLQHHRHSNAHTKAITTTASTNVPLRHAKYNSPMTPQPVRPTQIVITIMILIHQLKIILYCLL